MWILTLGPLEAQDSSTSGIHNVKLKPLKCLQHVTCPTGLAGPGRIPYQNTLLMLLQYTFTVKEALTKAHPNIPPDEHDTFVARIRKPCRVVQDYLGLSTRQ